MVEREHEIREGAGIYVLGNGLAALDLLGLGDAARERGRVIRRRLFVLPDGEVALELDEGGIWGRPDPCLALHRRALRDVLLEGAHDVPISTGLTVTAIRADDDGVEVTFSDGTQDRFDLVVGAEGIGSETRRLVLGRVDIRTRNPRVCRFIAPKPPEVDAWTVYLGRGIQILALPINEHEVYCYANDERGRDRRTYMDRLRALSDPVPALLESWSVESAHWSPLSALPEVPVWGAGRVVLIGDAAHAMLPYMAQGASMALEDAVVLPRVLAADDWSDAAERFTDARRARVAVVREGNRQREQLARLSAWLPFYAMKLSMRGRAERAWSETYKPLREAV